MNDLDKEIRDWVPCASNEDEKCSPDTCRMHSTLAELSQLRARIAAAEKRLEASTDWYQRRFNRLRTWVEDEVRPLSSDVARRYYSICANGSPAPHESADWTDTMHALRLRAEQAEHKVAKSAARLAAAEAVIAALPGCVCCEAPAFYFWAKDWDDSEWRCDEHRGGRDPFDHADELRAYLALVEADR